MKYVLEPSLEHISAVKVAVALWSHTNIQLFVEIYTDPYNRREKWKKIENKITEKVLKLPLPNQTKTVLLDFIKPIGSEMFAFLYSNDNNIGEYYCIKKLLNEIYWTPLCIIDRQKTILKLMQDVKIDIVQRYKIACMYCLEDYVHTLWRKLSNDQFYRKDLKEISSCEGFFITVWSYYADGKIDKMEPKSISKYKWAFILGVSSHNDVVAKYFLEKLSPEEQKCIVESAATIRPIAGDGPSDRRDTAILCCLLSNLTEEEQIEVFKHNPVTVLCHLLEWPFYDFFIPTAERMWNFLPEKKFYFLLQEIVCKFHESYYHYSYHYNYHKIFEMFWKQSPEGHKKFTLNQFIFEGTILYMLIKTADKENISLIFKYATVEEKEQIILNYGKYSIFQTIIDRCEWNLLEFVIQECISSKAVLIKFKQNMISHAHSLELDLCLSCKRKICEPFWENLSPPPEKIQRISLCTSNCNINERNNWSVFCKILDSYLQK